MPQILPFISSTSANVKSWTSFHTTHQMHLHQLKIKLQHKVQSYWTLPAFRNYITVPIKEYPN